MVSLRSLALCLASAGWLAACDGVRRVEDVGSVCVSDLEGWSLDVADGEEVALSVSFGCIGEHTLVDAACEVTVVEERFEVTAWAEYTQSGDQKRQPSCTSPVVTCTTGPLSAGSYTVHYANGSVAFDVPSQSDEVPCSEESW